MWAHLLMPFTLIKSINDRKCLTCRNNNRLHTQLFWTHIDRLTNTTKCISPALQSIFSVTGKWLKIACKCTILYVTSYYTFWDINYFLVKSETPIPYAKWWKHTSIDATPASCNPQSFCPKVLLSWWMDIVLSHVITRVQYWSFFDPMST